MNEIVDKDHPILRQTARPVPISDIGSPAINSVIAKMRTAMGKQKDGIAIAAPQIGVDLQIFVVSGTVLKQADPSYRGDGSDLIFINPVLLKISKEKHDVEEGCLSVRWFYGKVRRAKRVIISAYDETGKKIERGASGILAQVFQHEIDHLKGVLFIDNAKEVWEMTPEEIEELQTQNHD
ncbi:MAG: peptide deformylase [Candidatus Paceibacterota bacterium]|jgi:peptide deformylase